MTAVPPARAARVERLRGAMAEAGVEALVVSDLASVRWLTGFTGTAGRTYLGPGAAVLVTDDRYVDRAADEAPGWPVLADRTWGWLGEVHPGGLPLGIEADVVTWAVARELQELVEVVPTTGLAATLRQVKDEEELALLRRACAITDAAFDSALGWLAPGIAEVDVARRLVADLVASGADGPAFPPIVASGPNGARPHHDPGGRRLAAGDLVTMDFGALVGGYHADMTRTVALGPVDPALRSLDDLVRTAQAAGVDAAVAGAGLADVDRACRQVIADGGHGEHFRHGTGHGVGLGLHETPFLAVGAAGTLADRMTVTVEPGVYVSGLGGSRIEDVVLVAPDRAERLTTSPRALVTL